MAEYCEKKSVERLNSESDERFSYIFSDESENFRCPAEPDPGDEVSVRIRTLFGFAKKVLLSSGASDMSVLMHKTYTDGCFDVFEGKIVCSDENVRYYFTVEYDGGKIFYGKTGVSLSSAAAVPFEITPGFHVPEWSKGALQYQIFTDRFRNGSKANDVADREYFYAVGHSAHIEDWDKTPDSTDIRCFYGGDLQGIAEKLDYIQSLGVEVIYLNPIFVSPSSHKYDVQDYEHIDPHFAIIEEDTEHEMQDWEKHNGFAPKYIKRVTSRKNLEKSDEYFEKFCAEIHKRGMRIILDGVFNHCGSFNKWMDREGIYLGKQDFLPGAYQDEKSPYRNYFRFDGSEDGKGYEGWWGYVTLPKLNYEESPELCEKILSVAEKWAKPPYSIDGWRLDVAADLGHSEDFNHGFWKIFRKRLKAVNPDILIVAEHYGDPSSWLRGDQWDTVMNYDAFMDPVSFFFTGMEKHSDSENKELLSDGEKFFENITDAMARFRYPSLLCAMNELSNHDHSRFLTRTNMTVGRITDAGPSAASENINKGIFAEAVTLQMTWPGAPTVYYGDEAGQTGWTDPDSRRTYPWGKEDFTLVNLHMALGNLRKKCAVLRKGSFKKIYAAKGAVAFARFDAEHIAVTACNNTDSARTFRIHVDTAGAKEGSELYFRILTDRDGFRSRISEYCGCSGCGLDISCTVKSGMITFTLPPFGSCVLTD